MIRYVDNQFEGQFRCRKAKKLAHSKLRTSQYGLTSLTVPYFVSAGVMFEQSIRIFQSSPSRITDQYPLICVGPKFSPLMVELHAPVTHICLLSRPML